MLINILIGGQIMNNMTSKELVYAAIEGRKLENYPVTAPYNYLSMNDHWEKITGLPYWKYYEWLITSPEKHGEMYETLYEKWPFDIFNAGDFCKDEEERKNMEVVSKNGNYYYHFIKEDRYEILNRNIHESHEANATEQKIFTKQDVCEKVLVEKAEVAIAKGKMDFTRQAVDKLGDEKFGLLGCVINTFYSCSWHFGLTNMFAMLYEEPELFEYLSEKILEQNIERIRALASTGGDAIWIDDATATNDMISPAMYERFSLPYLTQQVKEIQRLGKKAVLIYFGGISDRIEQIASTGADVLMMETSMKGFVNDYDTIAKQLNGRMCLTGNLNPYDDIEITSEDALSKVIKKQVESGRRYGKYITSTGSPLTPNSSVDRIRKYIDLAHSM